MWVLALPTEITASASATGVISRKLRVRKRTSRCEQSVFRRAPLRAAASSMIFTPRATPLSCVEPIIQHRRRGRKAKPPGRAPCILYKNMIAFKYIIESGDDTSFMDGGSTLYLFVLLFLLILGGGYFAATEIAFASANVIRLRTRAEGGDPRAKKAVYISEHFDQALTTLLIGNNVMQALLAVVYILSGTFNTLTDLLVFVLWIFFTMGVFAVFILRKRGLSSKENYRVPLYPVTPIIGIAGGIFILVSTVLETPVRSLIGIGITLLGLPVYAFISRKK